MNPTREEILIGRVTDAEATAADWAELEALARTDSGVWGRLAAAQRSHADLARAVDDELTVAELVGVPDLTPEVTPISVRWRAYSGWAAAAAIGLAWAGAAGLMRSPAPPTGPGITQQAASLAPDELFSRYLATGREQGRVLAELPKVVVESAPAPGGKGVEILYLRQIIERAVVDNVYTVGANEYGEKTLRPADPALWRSGQPL